MNPHKATLEKSNERGPKRKNSNVGICCKKRRTMNTYKTTFEKSSDIGAGVLRERIQMWEYAVKKGKQ